MNRDETNTIVRALTELRWGHLPHRTCTATEPMQQVDKDRYRWHHPDAPKVDDFFNLEVHTCPHCALTFTCLPQPGDGQ